MTKEEAQKKTNDKVQAIEAFMRQMEVTVEAKEIITKDGFIDKIVVYRDNQKYDIQETPVAPAEPAKTEETPNA